MALRICDLLFTYRFTSVFATLINDISILGTSSSFLLLGRSRIILTISILAIKRMIQRLQ